MILDVNQTYHAVSDERQWIVQRKPEQAPLEDGHERITSAIHFSSLWSMSRDLLRRRIIDHKEMQSAWQMKGEAERMEKALNVSGLMAHPRIALQFGLEHFRIEREEGAWVLRYLKPTASTLKGSNVISYCPSIKNALEVSALRLFMAEDQTILFTSADSRLAVVSFALWSDLKVLHPLEGCIAVWDTQEGRLQGSTTGPRSNEPKSFALFN